MNNAIDIMEIGRTTMAIGNTTDLGEPNIATQQHIVPVKRGRGRPRKYPIKGTSVAIKPKKLVIRQRFCPIPDLLELIKKPGTLSVWGNIKKGKRVHKFKGVHRSKSESAVVESDIPSSHASNSTTVSESDCTSISIDLISELDSKAYEELSWFARIVIPGPIPHRDALFRDEFFSNISDFFEDVPILEDWELMIEEDDILQDF